jgi:hypothetical protein
MNNIRYLVKPTQRCEPSKRAHAPTAAKNTVSETWLLYKKKLIGGGKFGYGSTGDLKRDSTCSQMLLAAQKLLSRMHHKKVPMLEYRRCPLSFSTWWRNGEEQAYVTRLVICSKIQRNINMKASSTSAIWLKILSQCRVWYVSKHRIACSKNMRLCFDTSGKNTL